MIIYLKGDQGRRNIKMEEVGLINVSSLSKDFIFT